jgi:pimeloyl-ACP methyl ester carboxylesterase
MSDRVPDRELPTLEQRMDDIRTVMDAVGSERAAIFGVSEGGNMSVLFAATFPERTVALVTFGIFAKRIWSPDYPWAPTPGQRQKEFEHVEREWDGAMDVSHYAPSADAALHTQIASFFRRSASPGAALALLRMNTQIDIRPVLPAVRVPTLVLHRTGDLDANIEEGRWIASQISGARFATTESP